VATTKVPLLWPISPDWRGFRRRGKFKSGVGVKKRRVVMRSKGFLWLVAVLIGTALAFPPMISAAEKKAAQPCAPAMEKKEEKKAPAKAKSATGEVVSVDAKTGMLAVKVKDKEMSFTAETKVVDKVKVGETVTVSYTEKEGKMVASSVKAAKKKAEKKAEAKQPCAPAKK
jgi:hypothetical protein